MPHQYNVIIIDDEPFVLDTMADSFPWTDYGFNVIGAFSDSAEALEFVKNNRTDVVLSDICMPEIDGLELTKRIKEINPDITVILISAYTDFEYAREAIKLGVFEYITKPIDFNELEELCVKLRNSLRASQTPPVKPSFNAKAQKAIKKLLNQTDPNDSVTPDAKLREALPELKPGYIFMFTIVLTNIDSMFNNTDSTLDGLYNSINSIVTGYGDFTIIPFQTNFDEITYIIFSDILSFEQFIENTNQFVAAISEKIYSAHRLIFSVSYSCVSEHFDDFIHQYSSMNKAKTICTMVWESVKNGRIAEAGQNYSYINELCNNNNNNLLRKSIVIQLYQIISKNIPFDKLEEFEIYPTDIAFPIEMDIFNIPVEISKMTDYLEKTIINAAKYFSSPQRYDSFINSAIIYIDLHYAENISLSYLANASFMSESYFCVMFKKQTGTTVVNYINSVRIKNAKRLLRTTNMSTNDIAVATGFQNVRYFYKKFKEFTGCTAGDYRMKHSDI